MTFSKATLLTVTTSLTILLSIFSLLLGKLILFFPSLVIFSFSSFFLGSTFALDYPSTPVRYIVFQTIYRVLEIVFCLLVLIFAGLWRYPFYGDGLSARTKLLISTSVDETAYRTTVGEHEHSDDEEEDFGGTPTGFDKRPMVFSSGVRTYL